MTNDALLFVVFLLGVLAGCAIWDYKERKAAAANLSHQVDEIKKASALLADAHNNITTQMKLLGDKVSAHEFVLKKGGEPSNPTTGRKF